MTKRMWWKLKKKVAVASHIHIAHVNIIGLSLFSTKVQNSW